MTANSTILRPKALALIIYLPLTIYSMNMILETSHLELKCLQSCTTVGNFTHCYLRLASCRPGSARWCPSRGPAREVWKSWCSWSHRRAPWWCRSTAWPWSGPWLPWRWCLTPSVRSSGCSLWGRQLSPAAVWQYRRRRDILPLLLPSFLHHKNLLCFSFVQLKPLGCVIGVDHLNEHRCKWQKMLLTG